VQFLKVYLLLCSVLCNRNAAAVQGLGVTIDRCLMIFYGGLLRTLISINEFQRKAFFVTIDYIIYIT
jgi:succinate-acetate transporter protein